jgi:hypothetical protein
MDEGNSWAGLRKESVYGLHEELFRMCSLEIGKYSAGCG